MVVLVNLDERGARPRNFHESSELIAGRPRDRLVSCDWCLFPRQLQSGGRGGKYYASELPRLLSGSSVIHVKLGCPLLKLYFHRARYSNRHLHLPGLAIHGKQHCIRSIGIYLGVLQPRGQGVHCMQMPGWPLRQHSYIFDIFVSQSALQNVGERKPYGDESCLTQPAYQVQ